MSRRIPLWATLVPLVLGVLLWALLWRGYEARLESDLAKILPPGAVIEASGFPYRLEARIAPASLALDDVALSARVSAAEAAVNRVPWQRDRQVIAARKSDAAVALKSLPGAHVRVRAPMARASLRLDGGRIARLSILWDQPDVSTGLFAVHVRAGRLEAHLRETPALAGSRPAGSPAPADGPTGPTQAQLVLDSPDIRFGEGAPLLFSLDSEITAAAPVRSFEGWAGAGTYEIRSATLSDRTGEVARLSATLVRDSQGRLSVAGTIDTVCPASVRAAIAGGPATIEQRTRKPERIAISGRLPGEIAASVRDATRPPPPVRGQEPPCPRLR
jgi:hypothetical protein